MLRELAGRRADRLSMGQRQRLRAAMAFLHEPTVILLDEPHNSLDVESVELVDRSIHDLLARGGSALWCIPQGEHTVIEFDERYTMCDGRIERE